MFDVYKIRKDFPILEKEYQGKKNIYLDTAASAQKPQIVIDKIMDVYSSQYANIHRGNYWLSEQITNKYENARSTIQKFINSSKPEEIIFTRNATEAINLVAFTYGLANLKTGDEILISNAEHHANLVVWQQLALKTGATLKYFNLDINGDFNFSAFKNSLNEKTKIVAVTAMSNVLGTILPVKEICTLAHQYNAKVIVDACQFVVHKKLDVKDIDCDFLAFSSHKIYGPTGVGVLYGKYNLLAEMPPYQFGGDMIKTVSYSSSSFALPPSKFEAGTPAIVEAIGLAEALKYINQFDSDDIEEYERTLIEYTTNKLLEFPDLKIIGNAKEKGGVFSFNIKNIHAQDLNFILAKEGIAIRAGHFCAEPLVKSYGYNSLCRASLGIYSTKEDIDSFINVLYKAKNFLE